MVVAVLLVAVVGSVVDWLIVLSQFTGYGHVSPFIPPFALVLLVAGALTCLPAIALTSKDVPHPFAAAGLSLLGMAVLVIVTFKLSAFWGLWEVAYTLLWFTPIVLIATPIATWIASRTGHFWSRTAISITALVPLATIFLMCFLLSWL